MRQEKIKLSAIILGLIITALLILAVKFNVSPQPAPPAASIRLRVLATFFPLYDFAKNIGQDRIELNILFSQTPEVASFTPSDIAKINRADLVIKNGVGLEPVLDELIQGGDNQLVSVVDTSRGISLLEAEDTEEHAQGDPHVWLNPQNAIIQVENILAALSQSDPLNADFYAQNARIYIEQLLELDKEIEQTAAQFRKKDFASFHPAFSYFAKRYGLNQAAVFEEFPGKEPSPRYLSEIIKIIKDLRIEALFAEPQFSPKVMEVIAADLGLTVRVLDPIETGDPENDSYISLMRKNLQALREVLR